ncbi:MAG TPA: universal stress protein [Thermoanaerobaculia bacterium]|nr:universal stress protein [Thermoanaerobaculia bacterium]
MKLILVPTDMSETAAHALRFASAMAQRLDAHLLVLYSDTFMPPFDFGAAAAFTIRREELIDSAREQLELHVEQNVNPSVPYDARVLAQSPIDAILEQACDTGADLIVMGTHGRAGIRRLIIGSVTEAVIRLATVPVIAVNAFSGESPSIDKIVVPVTFDSPSLEALRYAGALAGGASLLLYRGIEGTKVPNAINEVIAIEDWIPRDLRGRASMKIVNTPMTAEEIAEYAKVNGAGLIAAGVPSSPHLIENLLHVSPCPVLTLNERTVRLTVPDRKLPLTAVAVS